MKIGEVDLKDFGKRLFKEVGSDDLSGAAAELAYRLFLALFPFFIFLAAMGGFSSSLFGIENPTEEVMDLLGDSLPSEASTLLREQLTEVTQSKNAGLVSVSIISAIWAASSGFGTLIKGMNRTYGVKETRPIWLRYGLAVGMTLIAGTLIVGSLILLVAGQVYGEKIAGWVGLEGAAGFSFTLARYPLIFVILTGAMAFLYWKGPNIDQPFKWISPGAIIFVCLWLVASFLFGIYVSNFGSYNATYGALGAVVILLFWLYLTGFLILLGSEINATLMKEAAPEEVLDEVRSEGAAGADDKPLKGNAKPSANPSVASEPQESQPAAGSLPGLQPAMVVKKSKLETAQAWVVLLLTSATAIRTIGKILPKRAQGSK